MPDDIYSFEQLILRAPQPAEDGEQSTVTESSPLFLAAQTHARLLKEDTGYKELFNRYAAFKTLAEANFDKASIRMFDENYNPAPLRVFFHDAVTAFLPFMRGVRNSLKASNVAATMYWICKDSSLPAPA